MTDSVEQYLNKSDDELYELIGTVLLRDGHGIGPAGDDRRRKFGRDWFANRAGRYRSKVCRNKTVQLLIDSPQSNRAAEATAIADALAGLNDLPISPYLLAVLISRLGLQAFCALDDDEDDDDED